MFKQMLLLAVLLVTLLVAVPTMAESYYSFSLSFNTGYLTAGGTWAYSDGVGYLWYPDAYYTSEWAPWDVLYPGYGRWFYGGYGWGWNPFYLYRPVWWFPGYGYPYSYMGYLGSGSYGYGWGISVSFYWSNWDGYWCPPNYYHHPHYNPHHGRGHHPPSSPTIHSRPGPKPNPIYPRANPGTPGTLNPRSPTANRRTVNVPPRSSIGTRPATPQVRPPSVRQPVTPTYKAPTVNPQIRRSYTPETNRNNLTPSGSSAPYRTPTYSAPARPSSPPPTPRYSAPSTPKYSTGSHSYSAPKHSGSSGGSRKR